MGSRLREALLGLIAAVASALASVFVFMRAVEKKPPPKAGVEEQATLASAGAAHTRPLESPPQAGESPQAGVPKPKPIPPGWSVPEPKELPQPTWWPITLSLAITFIFWGFVTSLIVTGVGIVLFAVALAGWLGDVKNEHEDAGQWRGHRRRCDRRSGRRWVHLARRGGPGQLPAIDDEPTTRGREARCAARGLWGLC